MIIFGNRLRELRKKRRLTQNELGNILGLSDNVLTNWERGTRFPSPEKIIEIAKFFCVTTDYLYGLTDSPGEINHTMTEKERLDHLARSNPSLSQKDKLEFVMELLDILGVSDEQGKLLYQSLKDRFSKDE